ncbi:MAG: hypothetical protein R3C02_23220 [Planctomycetaceae bacterium]
MVSYQSQQKWEDGIGWLAAKVAWAESVAVAGGVVCWRPASRRGMDSRGRVSDDYQDYDFFLQVWRMARTEMVGARAASGLEGSIAGAGGDRRFADEALY